MKSTFTTSTYVKDAKYRMPTQFEGVDNFQVGQYLGVQICDGWYSHSDLGSGPTYTAPEVFRVAEVRKGSYNLLQLETKHELIVESPDGQRFSITCRVTNTSSYALDKIKLYTWTLDESMVSYIEREQDTERKGEEMGIKVYKDALEVKRALEEKEKYKKEHAEKKKREEDRKLQEEKWRLEREAKERAAQQDIDNLFRSSAEEKITITCSRCGQKLRLPRRAVTLIYTCPKCGNKGEY